MKQFFNLSFFVLALFWANPAHAWWNKDWTLRKKITIDASAVSDAAGTSVILVRLHDGNFQFGAARQDGSDIRFVAADDKTVLKHHIERFDSLLYEAFAWVRVPDLKPGAKTEFWLYYGQAGEAAAANPPSAKETYDPETALVYHFAESNSAPVDASPAQVNADSPATSVKGALIGGGLLLTGQKPVVIPAAASFSWSEGAAVTWSAWLKPTGSPVTGAIFSRRDGEDAFLIGAEDGVPYVETSKAGVKQRTAAGAPLTAGAWRHLAVVADGSQITLFLDGETYATLSGGLPALNGPLSIGKDSLPDALAGLLGEMDELQIAKVARSAGFLKLAAINQSASDIAGKLLVMGDDEGSHGGENEITKHLSLLGEISKSLTFDGWAVIFLCAILALVGWWITVAKFVYLTKVKKASEAFRVQWRRLSRDLTVLDHGNPETIRSMGGKAGGPVQKAMEQSPLYRLYQIGSEEIQHRLATGLSGPHNLSGRSMQSIKASLDGGLVQETERLNGNLVFLTIGIAGGPYLGLLGTVIGVMITFAVIAKSGEVEVNSIAPGIAGALLATVAGLAVAIPALFAYSYISTRIKSVIGEMHVFIDEFVTKIAEFYSGVRD